MANLSINCAQIVNTTVNKFVGYFPQYPHSQWIQNLLGLVSHNFIPRNSIFPLQFSHTTYTASGQFTTEEKKQFSPLSTTPTTITTTLYK